MDLGDYLASRNQRDYPTILFNLIKYLLLVIVVVSTLYLVTIVCVFLVNQEDWERSATEQLDSSLAIHGKALNDREYDDNETKILPPVGPPSPTVNTKALVNLEVEMFQVKMILGLIYLVTGLVAILSEDFNYSLFFTFLSLIVFLFSFVKEETQFQVQAIIYSSLLTILSFLYCLLLKIVPSNKSPYYYGYLQS